MELERKMLYKARKDSMVNSIKSNIADDIDIKFKQKKID